MLLQDNWRIVSALTLMSENLGWELSKPADEINAALVKSYRASQREYVDEIVRRLDRVEASD